jgi:hypothetical protein
VQVDSQLRVVNAVSKRIAQAVITFQQLKTASIPSIGAAKEYTQAPVGIRGQAKVSGGGVFGFIRFARRRQEKEPLALK